MVPQLEINPKTVVQYTDEIPGFCAFHSQDMVDSLHVYRQIHVNATMDPRQNTV